MASEGRNNPSPLHISGNGNGKRSRKASDASARSDGDYREHHDAPTLVTTAGNIVVRTRDRMTTQVKSLLDDTGITMKKQSLDPTTSTDIALLAQRDVALRVWTIRVQILVVLQLGVVCGFLVAKYFYSSAISGCMIVFGFWGARFRKPEPTFVYMVLVILNFIKDIGVSWLYVDTHLLIANTVVDMALLSPVALYCGYYLHQTLGMVHLSMLEDFSQPGADGPEYIGPDDAYSHHYEHSNNHHHHNNNR